MISPDGGIGAGRPRLSAPLRRIARFLGPLALPLAGTRWLPLYSVLGHTGRRSGTRYATPVVGLRTADGFLIPLPFGDATHWARNLVAAGHGHLRHAGQGHRISEPRVVDRDAARPHLPPLFAWLAGVLGIRHFVRVSSRPEEAAHDPRAAGGPLRQPDG